MLELWLGLLQPTQIIPLHNKRHKNCVSAYVSQLRSYSYTIKYAITAGLTSADSDHTTTQ